MNPTTVAYASFELMGFDFVATVEAEVTYLGLPAKLSGPPERCWPEEPPEYDITSIEIQHDVFMEPGPKWRVDPKSKQFGFLSQFLDDDIYPQVCEFLSELRTERSYRRRRAY
jgi:hypothetical protein